MSSTGNGFRKRRASYACEACHARKVRCDALSRGFDPISQKFDPLAPGCSNCLHFQIPCKIPPPKRKKAQAKSKDYDSSEHSGERGQGKIPAVGSPEGAQLQAQNTTLYSSQNGTSLNKISEAQDVEPAASDAPYAQFLKPKFTRAPIKEAGRVAYMGLSSNLSLLISDRDGHYPLPDTLRSRARLSELDDNILRLRGAYLLPPRALCDDLVESYFTWVAPIVPVIDRTSFMARYKSSNNPPSLLLLQAVLLAGSRVCSNPQLMDANGSTRSAAIAFQSRARHLWEAGYESDRITALQSLILLGWYWERAEDVTTNVFYFNSLSITIAYGCGLHRSVENSHLSRRSKSLWKRIWWTLFTRDRSVAVALGRPLHINLDDSDVEMVTEDDFVEADGETVKYPPDVQHVQFFLQYVKLCEIMGIVLSQQYSVAAMARRRATIDVSQSDVALGDWLRGCPKDMKYLREPAKHSFWRAILSSTYYTTLVLLHRAHLPPATMELTSQPNGKQSDGVAYPSRSIALRAAGMITSIIAELSEHDELRYCPAFIVYSIFSALLMLIYQLRQSSVSVIQEKIDVCMKALKEVSKVWLVAKMVHTLFELILGNKVFEDKLQKAAGKRHAKVQMTPPAGSKGDSLQKRKLDEVDFTFANGPPVPQVSYERSRPQTPAATPSRETGHAQAMSTMPAPPNLLTSPQIRQQNDAFMGGLSSRSNTRPPTPFNPNLSALSSTLPDLFLVTRNSPQISQNVWDNFLPEDLFGDIPAQFGLSNLDPQLAQQTMPLDRVPSNTQQSLMYGQDQRPLGLDAGTSPLGGTSGMPPSSSTVSGQMAAPAWPNQLDAMGLVGLDPNDSWSSSSQDPIVPSTLNVEDWFSFFGINGELDNFDTVDTEVNSTTGITTGGFGV